MNDWSITSVYEPRPQSSTTRKVKANIALLEFSKTGGNQVEPQLPNTFEFLWVIGIVLSLLPVVTAVRVGLILRETVKIRRHLVKND